MEPIVSPSSLQPLAGSGGQTFIPNPSQDWGRTDAFATIRVTYSRTIRRITLQRFLVSYVAYSVQQISFSDILVLYDNMLWCEEKAKHDPKFRSKFGTTLEVVSEILKNHSFKIGDPLITLTSLSNSLRTIPEEFLYPRRNLLGIQRHLKGQVHIVPSKQQGVDNKRIPPPSFIGKGYRDKGTLRNTAKDGSPRWQEVAPYMPLKTLKEKLNE